MFIFAIVIIAIYKTVLILKFTVHDVWRYRKVRPRYNTKMTTVLMHKYKSNCKHARQTAHKHLMYIQSCTLCIYDRVT